jgi:hypothetical protein
MAKTVKIEKAVFDAALQKMIKARPAPLARIRSPKKKSTKTTNGRTLASSLDL